MAGRSGDSAQYSQLRAGIAIVGVERIADKAAVAGLAGFPAAQQRDLRLELRGSRRDQRNRQLDTGLVDRQPGDEIVASVEHQIVAGEQLACIVVAEALRNWVDLDVRVEQLREGRGGVGLGLSDLVLAEDQLTVEVRQID